MKSRYDEVTEWLFTQLPVFQHTGASAYKPGLTTALKLAGLAGNPHRSLRTIHVAGTNGKGSTSSMLAAILQKAGLKVGLYTSPHLVDFRERIRVDGRMISQEEVIDFVERFRGNEAAMALQPSFFELTTIMAFEHFKRLGVDVAVIEVGLGGRLDTTNIIVPDLAVITNISLDHTALLGNTRVAIAREKAGIIKPGVTTVIGEDDGETAPVFDEAARRCGSEIVYAREYAPIVSATDTGAMMRYVTRDHGIIEGELRGRFQQLNAATVLTAVDMLNSRCGYAITDEAIAGGMGHVGSLTGLTGRWTRIEGNPPIIYDTGHNIGGWTYIRDELNRLPGHKVVVVGFVNDKDVTSILRCISQVNDKEVIFTRASVARALDAAELQTRAREAGVEGTATGSVAEAMALAAERASAERASAIFVGGSNFVVGDFLALHNQMPVKTI